MELHQPVARRLRIVAIALFCITPSLALAGCPPNACCIPPNEPGQPACEKEVGDPVNVTSGNHFQREVDMPALPGVLGLELVRNYNSDAAFADERTLLGRGWRLSYDEELRVEGGGHVIVAILGDGTHKRYVRAVLQPRPDVTVYQATDLHDEPLRASRSGGRSEYRVVLDGNTHVFDSQRKLVGILAPTGESVTLVRDGSGALVRVTDPQGRSLSFGYAPASDASQGDRYRGVHHIDSPVGRFSYTYGSAAPRAPAEVRRQRLADLASVALPTRFEPAVGTPKLGGEPGLTTSTVSRLYHYEEDRHPGLMTGISVQGQGTDGRAMRERLATWAHDRRGRTVLSVRGAFDPAKPGIEQVTLRYEDMTARGGVTVLTNSLGQETRYTYGEVRGVMQMLEVRGAGCSSCGPVNVRYRYDEHGRLADVIALGGRGQPLSAQRTAYDGAHRPIHVGLVPYVNGKPGDVRWQVHYVYGPDARDRRPVRIIRPSVIPGQDHRVEIAYNGAGQPLQVTERGFSPIDDKGNPAPAGWAIERSTRYSYVRVNGRSLLHTIDGPLPNGPKAAPEDSDITRLTWDARGNHVESVELPMGLRRRMTRDPSTGLLTEAVDALGIPTRYRYGMARLAQPETIERAGHVVRFAFDALGRTARISDGTRRFIELDHDAAGQVVGVKDAQGYAMRFARDSEGLARTIAWHEPRQAKPLRATYRWFDALQRPIRQLRADGRLDTWAYDDDEAATAHIDGDSVQHLDLGAKGQGFRLDLSPDGWVRLNPPAASAAAHEGNRGLVDDFGRTVRVAAPGQGSRTLVHSGSDLPQVVRLFDKGGRPAGSVQFEYDAAGRLLRRTSFDSRGKPLTWLLRNYAGARLATEEDDTQVMAFSHDAQGRLMQTSIGLKDESGRIAHQFQIGTTYDASTGQPASLLLADGRVVHIRPDPATGVAARVDIQSAFWSRLGTLLPQWVHGWVPQEVLLSDLQFHPFNGITGYVQGNGLRTAKSFDLAGRLTAIQVPGVQDERLAYGTGPRVQRVQDLAEGAALDARYAYSGFGVLQQGSPNVTRTSMRAAADLARDELGRYAGDGQFRYSYTLDGQVDTVSTPAGRTIARYRYNSAHQRVSKTVWQADGQARTTYFLWQAGRVAAEIEGSGEHAGEVLAQYVYLSEGQHAAPVAKLESQHATGNATGRARTLFVHSNHRAEPVAMTDAARRVVWRGRSDPQGHVVVTPGARPGAILNLRLPGQYFDEETGLHDNWHRSYDPRPASPLRGRYLSPDPLGYPDGPDRYLYAQGDPVNRSDPMGLYEIDVHYYLTFFLAVAAGVDKEDARIIALATQYIDDNPATQPLQSGGFWDRMESALTNPPALIRYHFTQAGYDPPLTTAEQAYRVLRGKDAPSYIARRIANPQNPQLDRLIAAYNKGPSACIKLQLFGEYLHAFEDTFAHRNDMNEPYAATVLTLGVGHGYNFHDPDLTYDHRTWRTNYSRTLEMEKEVFVKMSQFKSQKLTAVDWAKIESTLMTFTAYKADEHSGDLDAKVDLLAQRLRELGFDIQFKLPDDLDRYSAVVAEKNRRRFLDALKPEDFVGTILPSGTAPLPQ